MIRALLFGVELRFLIFHPHTCSRFWTSVFNIDRVVLDGPSGYVLAQELVRRVETAFDAGSVVKLLGPSHHDMVTADEESPAFFYGPRGRLCCKSYMEVSKNRP